MPSTKLDASAIRNWSVSYIAKQLKVPQDRVDPQFDFDALGLDSASAVAFIMSLEEWLHVELVPELLFEYKTIATLSDHLVTLLPPAGKEAV